MILHLLLAVCLANENFLQHSQQTLERLTSDLHDSSRRFPGFKLMRSLNQLKHMFQEMIQLNLGRWQEGRRNLQDPETECTPAEQTAMMTCLLESGLDPTAMQESLDITVLCENIACIPDCALSSFPDASSMCDTIAEGYLTMPFPSCEEGSMDAETGEMDNPSKMTCGTDVMYMDDFADVASCEAGTDFLTRTVITNPMVVDESCQLSCDGDKITIPVECLDGGMDNLDIGADMSSNMVSHMSKLETCADETAGEMQTCVDGYLTIEEYDSDDCSGSVVFETTLSDACMTMDPTVPASMSMSCADGYSISRMCKDDAEKFDEMVFRSIKFESNTCIEDDEGMGSVMWTCADDKVTYTSYSDAACTTADGETWDLMTEGTCNNLQTVDENAIIATAMCDADYVTIYQCEVYGEDGTAIDADTVTKNDDGSFSTSTGGSVTAEEFKEQEKVDSSSFVSDVDPSDPEGETGGSNSGANTMFALVAIIAGCWAL